MIPLRIGHLTLRIHFALALIAGGLALLSPNLALRYLLLVGTLLLHELAHAIVALRVGGEEATVSLWPWGGVAHVPEFADKREAAVALAGPAANLLLASALALAGGRFNVWLGDCPLRDFGFTANLIMGIGNLLPLSFVDGGRALRIFAKRGPR